MKIPFAHYIFPLISTLSISFAATAGQPVKTPRQGDAPDGLDGRTIALWASHGNYYNSDAGEWRWQRAHLLQTIEDLFSVSFVTDLLAPMLENAGAYVMMPRERDTSVFELIIDPDSPHTPGYSETSGRSYDWQPAATGYGYPGDTVPERVNPMAMGKARSIKGVATEAETAKAEWSGTVPATGTYSVYVSYPESANAAEGVTYTVHSARGDERVTVNQTMGAGTWMRLGEFPFLKTDRPQCLVSMTNLVARKDIGKTVTADAVRIGGGMGNVSREGTVSRRPRWTEGSRYWLQYSGFPESVYAASDSHKDYNDDYGSRPRWVNYLTGGSVSAPRDKGLNIPIDLAIAIHTDAGTTSDSTFVGTLGIYSTDGGTRLGDGRRRTTNRALTEAVVSQITDDVRALHDPGWVRRKLRDRRYAEARIPLVPSTLIELLSHQNFADMRLAQDPGFRFDVMRAVYKGILRYLTPRGHTAVIQPLPVSDFAITNRGDGRYRLSWSATVDSLEPTATPDRYIIERRLPDGVFTPVTTTDRTSFDYAAADRERADFRIIAANRGGRSFPSEVLSLYRCDNGQPEVLIVNGFTRLSAPESFDVGDEAGFLDDVDHGVPYVRNIGYSGSQTDFIREHLWVDDIVEPGFGASADRHDGAPVAGNTFDFVSIHGQSIASAGYPYVSSSLSAYVKSTGHRQPIVDIILGKQKEINGLHAARPTRFKAFPAALQARLAQQAKEGVSIMASGAYVASDLFLNPFSNDSTLWSDSRFATEILMLEQQQQFAGTDGRLSLLPFWGNLNQGKTADYQYLPGTDTYVVESPDAIQPADAERAWPVLRFDGNSLTAGFVKSDGKRQVAVLSIPFETIHGAGSRNSLMKSLLDAITPRRRPMVSDRPELTPLSPFIPTPDPETTKPTRLQ